MNEKELLNLKERIEDADRDAARLEGQMTSLMESLKKLGYSSIEAAKKALKKLDDSIEEEEGKLNTAIRKVEEQYEAI
ncbi:hypothetical protein LCGC14_1868120 [marine sediment metagenome]|uniref:Uncharacterized protein n=1 Tax=marine sediment metagenome TaxID=412755 RepID=A0A0F9G5U3_9ZZZZ